jgi:hypothetical protein
MRKGSFYLKYTALLLYGIFEEEKRTIFRSMFSFIKNMKIEENNQGLQLPLVH